MKAETVDALRALHDRDGMRAFDSYMGWRPLEIVRDRHGVLIHWHNWNGHGRTLTWAVDPILFDQPAHPALKYRPVLCHLFSTRTWFGSVIGRWIWDDFAKEFDRASPPPTPEPEQP